MSPEMIIPVLAAAVQCGTPILYATLGEVITERAGILNLGVEGMMIVGAFVAFLVTYWTGNPWLAALAGGCAAGMLGLLHGLVCIVFQGNQVVSGLALTIFGVGLADYLGTPFLGVSTQGFTSFSVPFLGDIPYLGKIFFQHDALVNLSYILPILIWLVIERTRWGLALRATGEYPEAAAAAGINPRLVRWCAVFSGAFFVGIGGAYLSLAYTHLWANNMTAGRGWIAVALVIFAFWRPGRAVFGAYLFGGIMAFQLRLQAMGTSIPSSLLLMLPYALTILVLLVSTMRKGQGYNAPKALGVNMGPKV